MRLTTAVVVFWAVIASLLGARVVLHDQIALGDTPAGFVLALLGR